MVATAEAIRDRVLTLIEALTPVGLTRDKFLRYRNEGAGNFEEWALANPAACLRRFQARAQGYDGLPEVNNIVNVERKLILAVTIAYPQNSRAGQNNALDRDDMMDQDWHSIDVAVGMLGAGNFSGSNSCTPLGLEPPTWNRAGKVDFAEFKARFQFWATAT